MRPGLVAAVVVLLAASGCNYAGDIAEERVLTVYAAASLRTVFSDLGAEFEDDHPGVTVRFSFAGSSDLAAQVQQGAPADVVATADEATMSSLAEVTTGRQAFAANTLAIAVPPGNPAGIATLADLASPDVQLVVCAPAVPCGAAASEVEGKAGIALHPVSEEQSVTDVLGKVIAGEADAGLVYVTDVRAAGDRVEGIAFPEAAGVVNTYDIAIVSHSRQADLAGDFIELVTGLDGQDALREAGFAQF